MTAGFLERPTIRSVLQEQVQECGLACLTMIGNAFGHDIDLAHMRTRYPVSAAGISLAVLMDIAADLGLEASAYLLEDAGEIAALPLPAVLHWDHNHFVVLERLSATGVTLHDPAFGRRKLSLADFRERFSGHALGFERRLDFQAIRFDRREGLRQLLSACGGLKRAIVSILAVSAAVSLFELGAPILLQTALDVVLPREDVDLLKILTLGYAGLLLATAVGKWLRDVVVLRAAARLHLFAARNLVGHAFRLPLAYFEGRHPGDFVTRLDSLEEIKIYVTRGLATAAVDAAMSVLTVVMMYVYSPVLATIVTVTLAVVLGLRFAYLPVLRRNALATLEAKSAKRSRLIDDLRRVATLKVHRATGRRACGWNAAFARFVGADYQMRLTEANVALALHVFVVLATVATLYLGVLQVAASTMTIGMLYAFFAFRQSFFDKIEALITNLMHLTTVGVHVRRVADITEATPEIAHEESGGGRSPRRAIRLQGGVIRFGHGETPLLSDIDLDIDMTTPRLVAIAGPSGCGKSSLLRVLAGLTPLAEGDMLVDGLPLARFGLDAYRSGLGAVFADDGLLSGPVYENVTLFDRSIAPETVFECLRAADIWDEVQALPQGLATRIADENAILSSGQRRRLLLARALCHRPRLLILDEITANLDARAEARMLERLRRLDCIEIVATHSPAVMAAAADLYEIRDGRLIRLR